MRLLLAILAVVTALFATSLAATAQSIKQVEVVYFPDPQNVTGSVEVTNFPAPAPPSRFQLVGFSTQNFTFFEGEGGILAMTTACQADFAGSRVCTSVEIMDTVSVPIGLSGTAWVRPLFVPIASDRISLAEASGLVDVDTPRGFTCNGWSGGIVNDRGLTVDATGRFAHQFCGLVFSVACCAPVP